MGSVAQQTRKNGRSMAMAGVETWADNIYRRPEIKVGSRKPSQGILGQMAGRNLLGCGRNAVGTLVIAVLPVLAVWGSAYAQEVPTGQYKLAYKFRRGQESQYLLTQSTTVSSQTSDRKGSGLPTRTETRTKLWILTKVIRVADDGSAEIEQKLANYRKEIPIGRQKLIVTANERSITKTLDGRIFIEGPPGIGSMLGDMTEEMREPLFVRGIRMSVSNTGEQKARSNANGNGGRAGLATLSEISAGLNLVLPDKPLKVGDSWSDETTVLLQQGRLKANAKTVLQAVERVDGRPYARVVRTLVSTVEDDQTESGAKLSASVTGNFTYLFDIDDGHIEHVDYDIVQTSSLPGEGGSMRAKARGKIERREM